MLRKLLLSAVMVIAGTCGGVIATHGVAHADSSGRSLYSKYWTYSACNCTVNTRGGFEWTSTVANYPGTVRFDYWGTPYSAGGDYPVSAGNGITSETASWYCLGYTTSGSCYEARVSVTAHLSNGGQVSPQINVYWDGSSQQVG